MNEKLTVVWEIVLYTINKLDFEEYLKGLKSDV